METQLTNATRRLHAKGLHDGWDNEFSTEPKLVTVGLTPMGRVTLYDMPIPWEIGARHGVSPAVVMDQIQVAHAKPALNPFLGLAITVEVWSVDRVPGESIESLTSKTYGRKLKDHPDRYTARYSFGAGVDGELVIVYQNRGDPAATVMESDSDKLRTAHHSAVIKALVGLTSRIQGALDATELMK